MKYLTLAFAALTIQITSIQALQHSKPRPKPSTQTGQPKPALTAQQQQLNDALYDASIEGDIEKIFEFLSLGANPDATCPVTTEWHPNAIRGATALISAANRGNFEICQVLLLGKATPEIRDIRGHNALMHEGIKKNREIFFILLAQSQADNKSFDDLHQIEEFVKKYPDKENHELESLSKYVDSVCVKCIKEKADFTHTDAAGMHLLHYAASWSSPAVCQELIQTLLLKDITLNPKNKMRETPLHLVQVGHEQNCRFLLENGATINALAFSKNNTLQSPLEYALAFDKTSIAEILIESGASCNPRIFTESTHHLLKKAIYTNDQAARAESKNIINTFLLCCKRYCPQLPRDIRHMLLDLVSWADLGNYMVDRRLRGLSIPTVFLKQAVTVLHYETMRTLKAAHIAFTYVEESQMNEAMEENIKKRLARERLLCNN